MMTARSNADWRSGLIESYCDLFHDEANLIVGHARPMVGDGWREIVERLCTRIRAIVVADGGSFEYLQIKEKFGTLRVYWKGSLSPIADEAVKEAIDLAEARSATTCELCGEEGKLYGGAGVATLCETHAEGRPTFEVGEGGVNLQVGQRLVRGRWPMCFRVYDRDADRFVDDCTPTDNERG